MSSGLVKVQRVVGQLERIEKAIQSFPEYVHKKDRRLYRSMADFLGVMKDELSLVAGSLEREKELKKEG